jgi:2-desacetyl-2-hydroxyethyl bacteriochlorophyllide A dehydrogenase
MKAAKILQPRQLQIVDLPDPQPGPHELLLRVMASGICGTDLHIYHGEYLGDYPVIPGHEFSGIVEAVGSAVTRFKPGDRVAVEPNIACDNCYHCLNNRHNFCSNWSAVGVTRPGGMAERVVVPEKAAFDIGELPFEAGAFVEPLSCVLHGVERLQPGMAAQIAIFGAGPIGILLLQALSLSGAARISMVDRNTARATFAVQMGADEVYTSLDELPQRDYDVVVDATGVVAIMNRTLEFVRQGGKILLFGVPPAGEKLSIEAFQIFRKGLTILSSFTSLRNSYQAVELLRQGRISVSGLVSHELPLEGLLDGLEMLAQGRDGVRKVIIRPNRG